MIIMIRNDQIQAAIISYFKGKTNITDQLAAGATEIREDQWQSTDFTYPHIRVRLLSLEPLDDGCEHYRVRFSGLTFSEESSSQQADRIAGIIANEIHNKSFMSNGFAFSIRLTNLVPAIRETIRTWRSEAIFQGLVSQP